MHSAIVIFQKLHYNCRTAILKNASSWLLLITTLLWTFSRMISFQRQLQRYIYLEVLSYTFLTFLTVTSGKRRKNFYGFLIGKSFREKCKHTGLALNFIEKQSFSPKNSFSFHYIWIAPPWTSKKFFLKFSFCKGRKWLLPWLIFIRYQQTIKKRMADSFLFH